MRKDTTIKIRTIFVLCLLLNGLSATYSQIKMIYQRPPEELASLIDVQPPPVMSLSPSNQWLILAQSASLPSVSELAQPELRIAGIRINPANNGKSRASYFIGFQVKSLSDLKEYPINGLPNDLHIGTFSWSPDGGKLAFTLFMEQGISLWYIDMSTRQAKQLTGPVLNDALYGNSISWSPDGSCLLARIIDPGRGRLSPAPAVPDGPVIQENTGTKAPVRTYQDLLKNSYDESLFEYYCTSVLCRLGLDGTLTPLHERGIISSFSYSPDGNYILYETVVKPYSYLVPYDRFANRIEILDRNGKLVKLLADIPVAEDIPKGFSSVRKGPRDVEWRSDVPAELWWVEALDGGDAAVKTDQRDQLYYLAAPFTSPPQKGICLSLRYEGINWCNPDLAIVEESWWENRRRVTYAFAPADPGKPAEVLFDRSFEDSYNDPGYFITRPNSSGKSILLTGENGNSLFLIGQGASPEGDRPFLDKYLLKEKSARRIWRSGAPWYEFPYFLLDVKKQLLLTRRESVDEPPNFFLRDLKKNSLQQLSDYRHPYPQLKQVKKELLKYHRSDGVPLTGTLYLPYADDAKNKNLPVLMWAYPQEFKSADAAGQVKDSPYRFSFINWASPLFWLVRGYAIMDDPSLPIIGEGDKEPNDTYIDQLVAGAKAAIDTLVAMGVADPKRVAVGGHSYGAFMTANLVTHSDLFAAGIARSGAYNRTLTPFGFQAEERTIWEAPDVYMKMSPFMYADKVKEPLLLIHGEADNNSGTFPLQSERYYAALKGQGAVTRLVLLPYESHGYRGKESILHMLWEMDNWLQKYVIERK
jgi:dipeptidyl aminopeptidase/acylaminoacyl peptidase